MANKITLALTFMALLSASNVIAKELKLTSPLHIEADKQSARLKENVGVFEQNVRIVHANMKIEADYLETHKRLVNGEEKEYLIATGKPVKFSAKQPDGTLVEASALKVTYDVDTAMFVMSGAASFKQGGNIISADTITYDRNNEIVSSQKNKDSDNQVTTIITTSGKEKK